MALPPCAAHGTMCTSCAQCGVLGNGSFDYVGLDFYCAGPSFGMHAFRDTDSPRYMPEGNLLLFLNTPFPT